MKNTQTTRRTMLAATAATTATAIIASPAIAQGSPEIKWRMPLFVPKSVDSVVDASTDLVRRISEMTDGKFQIQQFGAGELVPGGPAVMDAVEQGTVECAYTLSYYSFGKDPAYAFASCLPFGLNTRGQASWILKQGGQALLNEFFNPRGTQFFLAGNSTAQMGGFFRKEINSLADLKGLKMRIPGLGGTVMAKLGVVPQQIAAGDIFPSLERGVVDAAEWAGPYDDLKFGLHKVAPYYYAPGWWEPQATIGFFINQKKWQELPKNYQAIVEAASTATYLSHCAHYDAINSTGLRNIVAAGAKLRFFSKDIMDAAYDAAFETFKELAVKSPAFAKIYPAYEQAIKNVELYYRVGDATFDNFVFSKRLSQ